MGLRSNSFIGQWLPQGIPRSALVAEHAGKPKDRLGHEGDDGQHDDGRPDEGDALADDLRQRLSRHVGNDEQEQAEWRRQQADHDVHYHDHPEMHEVDTERLGGGNHDRHDDQQDGRTFEQAAQDQQYGVDQHEESELGELEDAHELRDRARYVLDGDYVVEDQG